MINTAINHFHNNKKYRGHDGLTDLLMKLGARPGMIYQGLERLKEEDLLKLLQSCLPVSG
jgi:hypothetical protein